MPNGISLRLLIVSARAIDLVTLAFLVAASHDWASIRLWWHLCTGLLLSLLACWPSVAERPSGHAFLTGQGGRG